VNKSAFTRKIISWYEENKRDLPWRLTRNPYQIWLSEIILQQTRVAQGLPYYERFVENFPDVKSLADASENRVLRLWQGLGYYSRARNLHACAKKIAYENKGSFPSTYEELKALPGVGPYTAAAIASMAFGERVAVVDGNVFRVLARIFGIDKDISGNEGKIFFSEKANELIDSERPDIYNQAIMEFGALHCTPKQPKCDSCIFNKACFACQTDQQAILPVKSKRQKIKVRHFTYIIIERQGRLLMRKRDPGDIWSGLYDFFLVEHQRHVKTEKILSDQHLKGLYPEIISKVYKHILSHQHLMTRFIWIRITHDYPLLQGIKEGKLKFYSRKKVAELPKPKLITQFLSDCKYLDEAGEF